MRCLRHGCTRSSLNFWSGLTGPPWCLAPGGESRVCRGGGRRGGGHAQLGAGGDLGSLLGTLSTDLLLLGLRVLLVERGRLLNSLCGFYWLSSVVLGVFVLLVSNFCILILPYL